MKQFFIFWGIVASLFITLAIPMVYADTASTNPNKPTIDNPIAADNLQCLVLLLFKTAVNILAFVCVGYFIWVGFLFVQAQGNDSALKAAKQTLTNVIIGTVLVMGAWVFADILSRTINSVAGKGSTSSLTSTSC